MFKIISLAHWSENLPKTNERTNKNIFIGYCSKWLDYRVIIKDPTETFLRFLQHLGFSGHII